jgi:aquaporin Z
VNPGGKTSLVLEKAKAPPVAAIREALRAHWPEYLMEAAELGLFMISACLVVALLEYPGSPAHQMIPDGTVRRVLIGLAMGLTAVGIVYSPFGKQSGAHFNPAFTLTFWRLGKVAPWDAAFYGMAHFIGAVAGVTLSALLLGRIIASPAVNYVATLPGASGLGAAFAAEVVISFGLMTVVLLVSNTPRLARYTGLFAGTIVATYISIEAPLSGMSMNPARSFGPALVGSIWTDLWVYFIAPPLGMLLAAEVYLRLQGTVTCAKLHHQNAKRCIFCVYQHGLEGEAPACGPEPSADGPAEPKRKTAHVEGEAEPALSLAEGSEPRRRTQTGPLPVPRAAALARKREGGSPGGSPSNRTVEIRSEA